MFEAFLKKKSGRWAGMHIYYIHIVGEHFGFGSPIYLQVSFDALHFAAIHKQMRAADAATGAIAVAVAVGVAEGVWGDDHGVRRDDRVVIHVAAADVEQQHHLRDGADQGERRQRGEVQRR